MSLLLTKLKARAHQSPDTTILTWKGLSVTCSQLVAEIDTIARILSDNVANDDKRPIAITLNNGPAWVVIDLALIQLGWPSLPLPTFFTTAQIDAAMADCGAIAAVQAGTGDMTTSILGETIALVPQDFSARMLPVGTAKITYTSGSTGVAKGVCLSLAHLESLAESLIAAIGQDYAGVHVPVLQLGILLENVAGLYTTLMAGGCYAMISQDDLGFANPFRPDVAKLIAGIAASKATSMIFVPELLRLLMFGMASTGVKLPHLRLVAVGGAKVSEQLVDQARALNLPVFEGYGLSECASVVALNTPTRSLKGSVGAVLAHLDVSIADDGEIIVRHKHLATCFLGYVGGQNAPSVWPTGDLGTLSAQGELVITGRKKNVLITGFGRNVSPEWVEAEFMAEPQIGQFFVYGDAGPHLRALVVPSAADFSTKAIQGAVDRANARLPEYAQVGDYLLRLPFDVAQGEMTSNGRLRRDVILQGLTDPHQRAGAMPFYQRLRLETMSAAMEFSAIAQIRDGLLGKISLETYVAYLTEAYHHVKHTVPLMQATKSKFIADHATRGQSYAEDILTALDEYIEEETGHEHWILSDIKNSGGNAAHVRTSSPRIQTELMVSYVYDFIARINPMGFFGMVFVLEGTSVQLATTGAVAVQASLGLGDNCFSYLRSHGSLDQSHLAFFETLMGKITNVDDQDAIIHVARMMFKLFGDVFRAIPHATPTKELHHAL
jgi:long-chain acyl-CoA synthetase